MQIRFLSFLFVLLLPLFARENPFFPVGNATVPNYSTNKIEKQQPFESLRVKLPDSVRILKSISLTCENLDGSITTKEIPVNKAIDWHDTIVISKEEQQTEKQTCKTKTKKFQKIGSLQFITFYALGQKLKVLTKDKLLRKFKLVKPDRIVLDFRRDANFRTYVFQGTGIFKKITLGNHENYYRAVIELDGHYIYRLRPLQDQDGYILILE